MSVLVTGGAGYVGAHLVRALSPVSPVVVVDDESTGDFERTPAATPVRLDISAPGASRDLVDVMRAHGVTAVVHLAADKDAEASMRHPSAYMHRNLGGTQALLRATRAAGVQKIVVASSAAVYGRTSGRAEAETQVGHPLTPYGLFKQATETILDEVCGPSFRAISLRLFNVIGAASVGLGPGAGSGLLPQVFAAISTNKPPVILGDGYATPDGSCVRDYVDVNDVTVAFRRALAALDDGSVGHRVYNVGSGRGHSVREVMGVALAVARSPLQPISGPARTGDVAVSIASIEQIRKELEWTPQVSLRDSIHAAWQAWSASECVINRG